MTYNTALTMLYESGLIISNCFFFQNYQRKNNVKLFAVMVGQYTLSKSITNRFFLNLE